MGWTDIHREHLSPFETAAPGNQIVQVQQEATGCTTKTCSLSQFSLPQNNAVGDQSVVCTAAGIPLDNVV
jgi:hypothetical protein